MRKAEKKEVLEFVNSFYQAHEEIKKALEQGRTAVAWNMLCECQEFAIQLGETIEKREGEGHSAVSCVEEYCEELFCVSERIKDVGYNVNKICRRLTKLLVKIENCVKNEIAVRKEIAFFPYKASMWDSLESVYLAAREDPDCDAYCVPIPYFDMNPDHSFGQMHYEGLEYPEGIEVIDWQTYQFEERRPDVIYIHNPYDDWNYVTSVHPRFYSENLRKYTDTLVYIPYYSTTGGMAEAQKLCPAYVYADYIITQAPGFREYFDERIPDEKFLPFGSPKFDSIIRKCKNPPEPPDDWKEKMEGRKVYFYNTSINGMLADTECFLKKMRYVFSCFEGRKDACLLWRPHPLLESTFETMRVGYRQEYLELRREFLDKGLGIYDDTPDMEDTIALCDAYIGDAASSVLSLFGIVGKPIFVLNNRLHSEPDEDSWRGETNVGLVHLAKDRFSITQGNKLYISEPFKHDYKYLCDLSDYTYGGHYNVVYEMNQKMYVCPQNAQDILVIDDTGNQKKIELERAGIREDAFVWSIMMGNYIILLPHRYPAIVGYDTTSGKIKYLKEEIEVFSKEVDGCVKSGGCAEKNGKIYLSSPTDNKIYIFDIETEEHTVVAMPIQSDCGYRTIIKYKDVFWLIPCGGKRINIVRWNPDTNEAREYDTFPQNFRCVDPLTGNEWTERPFMGGTFYRDYLYLAPECANMYIKFDTSTGEMEEWKPPFEDGAGTEYFYTHLKSNFLWHECDKDGKVKVFSYPTRKLYEVDLQNNTYSELEVNFDVNELKEHEPGFCYFSQWLRYFCHENAFNSIRDFLEGNISGNQFEKDLQIEAYKAVASNSNGDCGVKIHEFMSRL